jgi:ribosomal protein S18 acetylase RimI-like enzyme
LSSTIRPATVEDAHEVAQLMYIAGKSHVGTSIYDLMWTEGMEVRLRKLQELFTADTRSWYHYSYYLVSEVDGSVAGSLCGFNELEAGGPKLGQAFIEIGTDRAEGKAMYERMRPFHRVNPRHYEDSWVIEHVGVFPQYRGRGVISSLLQEILERGRGHGYKRAEINMLIGNEPAQGAYEKAGFAIVEENTDPEFEAIFGSPGMVRMLIEL